MGVGGAIAPRCGIGLVPNRVPIQNLAVAILFGRVVAAGLCRLRFHASIKTLNAGCRGMGNPSRMHQRRKSGRTCSR